MTKFILGICIVRLFRKRRYIIKKYLKRYGRSYIVPYIESSESGDLARSGAVGVL